MNAGKSLRQVCGAGGDTIVTGLATDSRRVAPGDLLRGEASAGRSSRCRFGHSYQVSTHGGAR